MEQVMLNLLPIGSKSTCHASQYDVGRVVRFNLMNGALPYNLTGTETITIKIRKPSGTEVIKSVPNTSDTYVDWTSADGDCDEAGKCECELSIAQNSVVIGTKNFIMKVEADAYDGANVVTRTASGRIATFETNLIDVLQEVKCEINPKQDLHGYDHPWAGGAGKNKLNPDYRDNTSNNIKFYNGVGGGVALQAGQAYTISVPNGSTHPAAIYLQDYSSGTEYAHVYSQRTLTYTPSANCNIKIDIYYANSDMPTEPLSSINVQLEKGSSATVWEPYSNICPIVGHSELNLTRCGINQWDGVVESGYIYNGTEYPSASYWRTKNYIPIAPNTEYYFRASANDGQINWYDINKTFISAEGSMGGADRVATSPANAYFVRFYQPNSSDASDTGVNYPATDTEYHAYNGTPYLVQFGQVVYGGVYDKSGRLTITHKVIALDQISWDYLAGSLFMASIADCALVLNQESVANWKCSCFPIIAQSGHQAGISGISGSNWFNGLTFWNEEGYTQATFETAISGQYIAYELATPIVIDVPSISVFAENGTNNVFSDTGDTEVKYLYKA